MTASPDVLRSRDIRRRVLAMLAEIYDAAPGVGIAAAELVATVERAGGPLGYEQRKIEGELVDLQRDGMVEIDQKRVRLTSDGRDFLRAGCPWERIDPYSGG